MTWMPTCTGRPVELLRPDPAQVDFRELAHALAHVNRFGGHAATPVSVALHTLIGFDLAPPALRPWWLLHDAHEAWTGDVPTPVRQAWIGLACELFDATTAERLDGVWASFEARHTLAVHLAAGLPLPSGSQRDRIAAIDRVALVTERRDFLAPQRRPWAAELEAVTPGPKVWRWKPPADVADALYDRFRRTLPALAARAA